MESARDLYIISGAAGFLGSAIIRQLTQESTTDIRALSLPGENRIALDGLKCQIMDVDVTRPETLEAAFADTDPYASVRVIHCAGVIDIRSRPNPAVGRVNIGGTRNMLDAARKCQERTGQPLRFVDVGSVHAIPAPEGDALITETEDFRPDLVEGQYAKSKAAASRLVMEAASSGLDALVVEPAGIIGPRNYSPESMKRLMHLAATGRMRVAVKGGYNFADVRDVAAGTLTAARKGRNGRSYILSGHNVRILDLINQVCAICGEKPVRLLIPLPLARLFAPLCEWLYKVRHEVPLFTPYALGTLQANSNFSCERARKELGYTSRPLHETLADTVSWMQTDAHAD